MIYFNFNAKNTTIPVHERYYSKELPEFSYRVCRNIERKQLATFSIQVDGLPHDFFNFLNVEHDFLSIISEIKVFLFFLSNESVPVFQLFFYECDMMFEFQTVNASQLAFKLTRHKNILLEDTVERAVLRQNVETMFQHFSELVEHKFPRAYKIFKTEDFIL